MSPLTRADARRIATLARLELTEPELDLFARQLTSILEHADSLQSVNTDGVPPYGSRLTGPPVDGLAFNLGGQWREDTPGPSLSREDALSNAPNVEPNTSTFVVPKVIG